MIRKQFNTPQELVTGLYAALVEYLEVKELIRFGPFDATPCGGATLSDLDSAWMARFVHGARRIRQFALPEGTPPEPLLEHLKLLNRGRLTNAAILLFGDRPQRFLLSSEIKCAHFHGTEVEKPIPSYQVYQGTVFEMVDQAVDFVLSKVNRAIGTRSASAQAPRTYEIPEEVVTEAIVNAVAHRDYTSNGSVQVMLFADRLEVWNPGSLPPPLTFEKLRGPHASVPANPLLAESMYLVSYIERMGTGTLDMIRRCVAAGLPEPEFTLTDVFVARVWRPGPGARVERNQTEGIGAVTPEVTPEVLPRSSPGWWRRRSRSTRAEVLRLLSVMAGVMSRREIQAALSLADQKHFRQSYLQPAIAQRLLEMTIPEKPRSRLQRYRLTDLGRTLLARTRATPGSSSSAMDQ